MPVGTARTPSASGISAANPGIPCKGLKLLWLGALALVGAWRGVMVNGMEARRLINEQLQIWHELVPMVVTFASAFLYVLVSKDAGWIVLTFSAGMQVGQALMRLSGYCHRKDVARDVEVER